MELTEILRLAGMCLMFCEQPETTGPFLEWMKKAHAEQGDCTDGDCLILTGTVERWKEVIGEAAEEIGHMLIIAKNHAI